MPLTATGIAKRFKDNWALRDVSFAVGNGRILGIFGRAASGKSTLARILAGAEKPDCGNVDTLGDAVHLEEFARPRRGFFSTTGERSMTDGQAAEAALEKALASAAKVVVVDLPLGTLDLHARARAFTQIRSSAAAGGRSIIICSANFEDVLEVCDEVVVLERGEVIQIGAPSNIYTDPKVARIAELTGRCNIFEARRLTSSKADEPLFQTIEGEHRLNVVKTSKARLGALNKNVRLGIRPEHISIAFGASFPEDNLLKATIGEVRFLGPNTLVALDAGGLRLEALVMRLVGLNIGDECMLGLPPERITVFTE